jgi:hypothetical protein
VLSLPFHASLLLVFIDVRAPPLPVFSNIR